MKELELMIDDGVDPTRQLLAVVTPCKHCKHRRVRHLDNKIFCWRTAYEVKPDDYCSRGELEWQRKY